MVTINRLAEITMAAAGKQVTLEHIPGPLGVRGRNSHNDLIRVHLGWEPEVSLQEGIRRTYAWVAD
jgi:GDP-D-mannose 3', 5'-epimerase